MQISTNQFYNTSNSLMSQPTEQADKLQTQISTGKRLQDPSDDAVAYQQLQLLARQTSNDSAYQANVATAQSLLTQSDSTLTSVVSHIQRAQELAVEAAVRASKEIALQALLIDPVVNSASAAVKLLDELWEVNRPYIRPCV